MADLLAHWKLNDNAANTTVTDSGPNSNDGTASENTSDLSITGKINDAFEFYGSNNEYVELMTGTEAGNIIGDESSGVLTIAFWFKADISGTDYARIIDRRASDYWGISWEYSYENLRVYNTGDTLINFALSYGTWYHVFVELDYDSGTANLWVDNSQNESGSNVASNNNLTSASGTSQSVCLAVRVNGGPSVGYKHYDGLIDDVRLYSGALTSDERDFIYNSGNGTEDEISAPGEISGTTTTLATTEASLAFDTTGLIGTIDALSDESSLLDFDTIGLIGSTQADAILSGAIDLTLAISGTISATALLSGDLLYFNLIKPSITTTTKRLVAAGNNIIYYEDI